MAWITGNGSSVGPGIMRTGRAWHWAQLIVTSNAPVCCSGDREVGSHRGWPEIEATRLRTPDLGLAVKPALLSGCRPAPDPVAATGRPRYLASWPAASILDARSSPSTRAILACGSRGDAL